jgi:hypothetical protein
LNRGERRQRTERVVKRRLACARWRWTGSYWTKVPGRLKKRPPVCYCPICVLSRKAPRRIERAPEE